MVSKKETLITHLLKITGFTENLNQQHVVYKKSLMTKYPRIPIDVFNNLYNIYGIEEYQSRLYSMYDELFSQEELEFIINFYASQIGSKLCKQSTLNKLYKIQEKWFIELEQRFFSKHSEYTS